MWSNPCFSAVNLFNFSTTYVIPEDILVKALGYTIEDVIEDETLEFLKDEKTISSFKIENDNIIVSVNNSQKSFGEFMQ